MSINRDIFEFCDDLGPWKVVHIHEPAAGLKAILVVDNVAAGPAIGGLRMASDVSAGECFRLARAMTLKNAAAGLPHGGAKSVLFADPKIARTEKECLVRRLAASLSRNDEYIFGPDMGTNEQCMGWVHDEIGRAVGLPPELGGIPLDELGATGWGLRHAVEVAAGVRALSLSGARVVVQGFGSVGRHAAAFLAELGTVLVGVADSRGAVTRADGLDLDTLVALKEAGKSVAEYPGGTRIKPDLLIDVECDIWIPAARPDVIREDNAGRLRTQIVVEGANIALTSGAERQLHERGVLCIPDFIANAGGVICGAMEYRGASRQMAFAAIEEKVRHNTEQILDESSARKLLPREAARQLAMRRLKAAMDTRRCRLFSSAPHFV